MEEKVEEVVVEEVVEVVHTPIVLPSYWHPAGTLGYDEESWRRLHPAPAPPLLPPLTA